MIELYSGTPGSGKSLHMAKVIKEQIQKGRPCIGNFQINYDMIRPNFITKKKGEYICIDFDDLTPDTLMDLSRRVFKDIGRIREEYILLFIDEAQLYFNSREWNSKGRKDWLKFFTLHRHYGYHIILVAQFDRMLDRQIRSLIEYECVHRKAGNIGLTGAFLNLLCLGGLHVSISHHYSTKLKLRTTFFKCRKQLYKLYDTFALFDSAVESGDKGAPIDTALANNGDTSQEDVQPPLLKSISVPVLKNPDYEIKFDVDMKETIKCSKDYEWLLIHKETLNVITVDTETIFNDVSKFYEYTVAFPHGPTIYSVTKC